MLDRLSQLTLRARWIIWIVVICASVALWRLTPPLQFDQTLESFFPDEHPALASYRMSKESFGGDQLVFVVYDDPQLFTPEGMLRVRKLADQISKRVPGVLRVDAVDQMPIPWKVDDAVEAMVSKKGSIFGLVRRVAALQTVRMAVQLVADDERRCTALRSRIASHPLFNGLLVDSTGQTTAIIVKLDDPLKISQRDSVVALRTLADEFGAQNGLGRVAIAGPPVLVVDGFISLEQDNRRLGLVAMILMAVTMLFAVRNPAWALMPLLAGWATWQVTQAFISWFGLKLTLSTGMIVAQTIVLCMPATSHLVVRFAHMRQAGLPRMEAARSTLSILFEPIAWCTLTAAAGYLAAWATTSVQPVKQLGLTMFVCNLLAGILSWCLAGGAMGVHFRPDVPAAPKPRGAVSNRVAGITEWVLAHPLTTLGLFVLPVMFAACGVLNLQYESNYINVYRRTARVAQDYRFVESRLGGIGLVELVFPSPEQLTPEWLAKLSATANALPQSDPELVSGVVSLANILTLPQKSEDIDPVDVLETKLHLLSAARHSHFLNNLWNESQQRTRILVRIRESAPAERKQRCFQGLRTTVESKLSPEVTVTGISHLMTQITQAVVSTSFRSTLVSAGIILVMLWGALRHPGLAALALTPTLLAVLLVLGVMGWLNTKIDISTATVASVAIGLSVDDAFHCLLRWKEECRSGQGNLSALRAAYAGSGPGVILSSAAVSIGFLTMIFSEFIPMSNFGWLVAVATLGGSLGNLIVIPAVLAVAGRKP